MCKSFEFEYLNFSTSLCDFFIHAFYIFLNISIFYSDLYRHFLTLVLLNLTQISEKVLEYGLICAFALKNLVLLKGSQAKEIGHVYNNKIQIREAVFSKYFILS